MSPRDPVRFVIFAAPRTGSNLLCSLLGGHPDVLCHHGLFNPGGVHMAHGWGGVLGSIAERDRDPAGFLDRVWESGSAARATGFKLNLGESPEAIELLLRDPSVRKLLLRRRNRLRTYVSEAIADRTGIWESYDPPAETALPAIHIDVADLRRHAERNAAWYAGLEAMLAETGQDWLDTEYEALSDRHEIARILDFLDVGSGGALASASRKRGPADLGAVIANLDALTGALAGTPFAGDLAARDAPDLGTLVLTL